MEISWSTILTVAATTGVLTALLNHVLWVTCPLELVIQRESPGC